MSGVHLEIKTDDKLVLDALAAFQRQVADMEPAFRDIGEALLWSHQERWDKGIDADGNAWAPLSPDYLARKPKNADKVLVLDGYLEMLHYQAGPDSVAIGTDRIYGATMFYGAKKSDFGTSKRGLPIPWGDIPAREFLGVSEDDRDTILSILGAHLMSAKTV